MQTLCKLHLSLLEYTKLKATCPYFEVWDHFVQKNDSKEVLIIKLPFEISKTMISDILLACTNPNGPSLGHLSTHTLDQLIQVLDFVGADGVYRDLFLSALEELPNA